VRRKAYFILSACRKKVRNIYSLYQYENKKTDIRSPHPIGNSSSGLPMCTCVLTKEMIPEPKVGAVSRLLHELHLKTSPILTITP